MPASPSATARSLPDCRQVSRRPGDGGDVACNRDTERCAVASNDAARCAGDLCAPLLGAPLRAWQHRMLHVTGEEEERAAAKARGGDPHRGVGEHNARHEEQSRGGKDEGWDHDSPEAAMDAVI